VKRELKEKPLFSVLEEISTGLVDVSPFEEYLLIHSSQSARATTRVIKSDSIKVGEVEGSSWVRVPGKGNFMSSPRLKECVNQCFDAGAREVVIDLEECSAMDSTFMGTLAGFAGCLLDKDGRLVIVGLSERNRDSLVDLGLDAIMEMENEDGTSEWSDQLDEIRGNLKCWDGSATGAAAAEEVLEAHRKLCEVDSKNNAKFSAVLEVLGKECADSAKQ